MRIGFKVMKGTTPDAPSVGTKIFGTIAPPILITDDNGEAFGIAPVAVLPAKYVVDVTITCCQNISVQIRDVADELSTYYTVNLTTKTWTKETSSQRMPGDGFNIVDTQLLLSTELIQSDTDPALKISNCALCMYLDRIQMLCRVNGKLADSIKITNPFTTTSRLYYPFFLIPSINRIERDKARIL